MSGPNIDREARQAIHDHDMRVIGDAYIRAQEELVRLRAQSWQIRRYFKYDGLKRTWHCSIGDDEVALLNLGSWFHP